MIGEVDSRHMALINEVFQLGVNVGINKAKESLIWRINGPMWAGFIDKAIIVGEDEECQS